MPKRQSENSEDPFRKMRLEPTSASEGAPMFIMVDENGEKCERSPLQHAAEVGDVQTVKELIARGADTRLPDRLGWTPLHLAVIQGKKEAADLLAAVGYHDIEDVTGRTPLHWAAFAGFEGIARRLLAGGARTRVRDILSQTPLHKALEAGWKATAELLVEADGGINSQDFDGRTPLHYAVDGGLRGIVATLLLNDHDAHVEDINGDYPIHLALRRGRKGHVPKMILSWYALKGIPVNWGEMRLSPGDLRFCLGHLSRCSEEIRLMKDARVGDSSVSYHDLVTRHVSAVAPRLPSRSARGIVLRNRAVSRCGDFPHYAGLISVRLRSAMARRVSMKRCLRCLSLLPPDLPPVPVTCSDVILRCLGDGDMENFIRAMQSSPPE